MILDILVNLTIRYSVSSENLRLLGAIVFFFFFFFTYVRKYWNAEGVRIISSLTVDRNMFGKEVKMIEILNLFILADRF